MPKFSRASVGETLNFANTSDTPFSVAEVGSGRFAFLGVDSFVKDTGGNVTISCEFSYDKTNWYRVKLPTAPATDWTKVYSASVSSAELVPVYDTTANIYIPIPAPFIRFTAKLASFAGSPTLTGRQILTEY